MGAVNKKRLVLLAAGLFIFGLWAGTTWWNQQTALQEQEEELTLIRQQVEDQNLRYLELHRQIERLHDPEYIAEVARRDYFLSKKGELIFSVPD